MMRFITAAFIVLFTSTTTIALAETACKNRKEIKKQQECLKDCSALAADKGSFENELAALKQPIIMGCKNRRSGFNKPQFIRCFPQFIPELYQPVVGRPVKSIKVANLYSEDES
jgi:hypothetical protein